MIIIYIIYGDSRDDTNTIDMHRTSCSIEHRRIILRRMRMRMIMKRRRIRRRMISWLWRKAGSYGTDVHTENMIGLVQVGCWWIWRWISAKVHGRERRFDICIMEWSHGMIRRTLAYLSIYIYLYIYVRTFEFRPESCLIRNALSVSKNNATTTFFYVEKHTFILSSMLKNMHLYNCRVLAAIAVRGYTYSIIYI